jgi:glutathione S-transferase
MRLKVAVFDFCPYCQRVLIVLEHYGLPYELVTVDPEAPPEWFAAASPRGKVPVLMVDETPILESVVIGQFVDEVGGRRLMPDDPLARAQVRYWADFASACQTGFGNMVRAADEDAFVSARRNLHQDLVEVDRVLDDVGPYFAGGGLCFVDVVFAPLVTRMLILEPVLSCFPAGLPKLRRWAEAVQALPEVDRSVAGDLQGAFASMVSHLGPHGYVNARLMAAR